MLQLPSIYEIILANHGGLCYPRHAYPVLNLGENEIGGVIERRKPSQVI